jgi:uncharacterized repeat protein (TIGR03803 family)
MQNYSAIHWREVSGALALAGLVCMAVAIGAPLAQAQTYTVLHTFKGGETDGMNPEAGLFMDKSGNLYGTTVNGPLCSPTPCTPFSGLGIIFKLSATGAETVLHHFTGSPDGANPYAALTANGYGTTAAGGASNLGSVFKLGTTGVAVLHSFTGFPGDGASPYAGLIEDPSGNLYGTTSAGGTANNGIVFELSAAGKETILYNFTGGADGGLPYGSLVRDSAGNLYGTASAGGTATGNCFPAGCGVIFELSTAGKQTVLHSFTGSPDGAYPYAGIIPDSAGNLYGTTYSGGTGGCTNGCGAVFKLDGTARTEMVLHSFTGYPTDGAFPYASLVRDPAGNLYGTAAYGGASDNGVVFKVSTAEVETILYSFTGKTDGGIPRAPLILDSKGNLYGTTYSDGIIGSACGGSSEDSCGVVFKIVP